MSKSTELCRGCRNDYYNHNREGGCWLLKNAKKVQRVQVGTWQPPPYRWRPQTTYDCHRHDGSSWLKRTDVRVVDDTDAAVTEWKERHGAIGENNDG